MFLNLYNSPRIYTIFFFFNRNQIYTIISSYPHHRSSWIRFLLKKFYIGGKIEKRCIWASSFRDRCRVWVMPTVARIPSTRNRTRTRYLNPSRCSAAFSRLQSWRPSWTLADGASVDDSIEKLSLEEAGWSVDWRSDVPATSWNPEHGGFFFSW